MISKEKFVEIIEKLRKTNDLQDFIQKTINESGIDSDFIYGHSFVIAHEEIVVDLLTVIMNDDDDDIGYFIYELDYGRNWEPGYVTDKDGNDIDAFQSADKLYDYLISRRNENGNQ